MPFLVCGSAPSSDDRGRRQWHLSPKSLKDAAPDFPCEWALCSDVVNGFGRLVTKVINIAPLRRGRGVLSDRPSSAVYGKQATGKS